MTTPENTLRLLADAIEQYGQACYHAGMERQSKLDAGEISEEEALFHHDRAKAQSSVSRLLYDLRSQIRLLESRLEETQGSTTFEWKIPGRKDPGVGATTDEIGDELPKSNPRFRLLDDAWIAVSRTEYGGPEASFGRIADLWQHWLTERCGIPNGVTVSPEDVAVMLMLLKVARLMSVIGHHDSIVDIAGYAACLAEIVSPEK